MASPDGGVLSARPSPLAPAGSSSEGSGESSHAGGFAPTPGPSACPWRTADFHDQECSRYFDCPSHVVERALSENGDPEGSGGDQHADTVGDVPAGGHDETREDGEDAPRRWATPSPSSTIQERAPSAAGEGVAFDAGPRASGETHGAEENPEPPVITVSAIQDENAPAGESDQPATPSAEANPAQPLEPPEPDAGILNINNEAELSAEPAPATEPRAALPPSIMDRPLPPSPVATERSTTVGGLVGGRRPAQRRHPPEIVLPRWQPDAEVTYCPICHTQFSIFVRKHHCRKCGRVVCNSCSPHRITIPYQYIVQPPGTPRVPSSRYSMNSASDEGLYPADFSTLGGGERVRLCNPCVPDPNTTPPQPERSPSLRGHSRSQSQNSVGGGYPGDPSNRFGTYFATAPGNDAFARSRSVTMQSRGPPSSPQQPSNPYPSLQGRILAGTPPIYFPSRASSSSHNPLLQLGQQDPGASSSSIPHHRPHLHHRSLPPPPPIAEEDECPVCHRELPARDLPNFESLREAHITDCIASHSAYGSTPTGSRSAIVGVGIGDGPSASSDHGSSPVPSASTAPPRRTGMFPYTATEKDCVDSAECTICLEEFEVGVPMARLECLCRFHRACIRAWFVNHPGRCPVHQHDSFGY